MLQGFLESVRDDRLAACWRFLAMTGCRREEVLGLRWRDLDLDAGRAMIVPALVGNRALSETKSERGRRTIALDPTTVAALREHRRAQEADRRAFGSATRTKTLSSAGRMDRRSGPAACRGRSHDRSPWPACRNFAHDLRHTHATLAFQAGVHPKVGQERLGHATISITLDVYSHAIPAMQEDAAARVAAFVDS